MDVQRQIAHWRTGSDEDLAAAKSLLQNGHPRHALFFAHLAIEKMLKALVTRQTGDVPPPIHNFPRLVEIANLTLPKERENFLREFSLYQLAGRYPVATSAPLDHETARMDLSRAEEMLQWLKAQF